MGKTAIYIPPENPEHYAWRRKFHRLYQKAAREAITRDAFKEEMEKLLEQGSYIPQFFEDTEVEISVSWNTPPEWGPEVFVLAKCPKCKLSHLSIFDPPFCAGCGKSLAVEGA